MRGRPRLVVDNALPASLAEQLQVALAEYQAAAIERRDAERQVMGALLRIAEIRAAMARLAGRCA